MGENEELLQEALEALKPFAEHHFVGDNYVRFAPRLLVKAREVVAKLEAALDPMGEANRGKETRGSSQS